MNGQLATSQSPSEYAAGGSSSYNYDADGNLTSETIPYATPAPTAQYFYDGADRLVEVETPADSTIDSGATGFTRYFYDLSQGLGHLTFSGESNWFYAYGNLYKVQRCLAAQGSNNCGSNWQDITAQASDPLDRPTALYAYQPGNTTAQQTTYAYDAGGNLGLLTSTLDPVGAASAMSYDWDDNLTSQTFGGPNPSSNRSYTYDADGRVLSASSLAGGTYTYTYYADGNVNTVQEPPVTGLTGQPLLRDSYYPNGWRQSLTINAPPAINNVQEFNYGYRADGLLAAESVANQGAFSASYTEAGRPLTLSDPFTGSNIANNQIKAHSFSYDANGQLSSELLPNGAPNANGGSYTNIAHTAEGDPSSYAITLPWYTAPNNSYVVQMNLSYNARDELVEQKATAQDGVVADNKYQDLFGHICPTGACGAIDPPTGALLSGSATTIDGCTGTFNLSYDADGRISGYTASENSGSGCTPQQNVTQDTRTYDTDSHTLSDACTPTVIAICSAASTAYSWAPTGAMSRYVTTPSGTSYGYGMHWDGNQLLFINSDQGVLAQLDVGAVGAITNPTSQTPNAYAGLTVFDRDFTQSLATRHQSGGADNWIVSNDAFTFNRFTGDTFQTVTGTYPGFGSFDVNNTVTSMARPDGYGVSTLIFQGVRAYDPFAMQWTSPDKYAGTTTAATQQSYTWNGNNPIKNRDESGLCWTAAWGTTVSGVNTPPTYNWHVCQDDNFNNCDIGCTPGYPGLDVFRPGSFWRSPDLGAFQLCAGPVFGACLTLMTDACGRVYLGLAGQIGKSPTLVGWNAQAIWIKGNPTNAQVNQQVTGSGWQVGGGFIAGGQVGGGFQNFKPTVNNWGGGLFTPQFGASLGYTWQVMGATTKCPANARG